MVATFTNREVVNQINALTDFGGKVLPVKLSFAITKNLEKLREVYVPYEKELRRIQEEHSEKDGEGNVKYKNEADFEAKLKELLGIENTIECHEITEEMLEQCMDNEKYADLTMDEIGVLMRFIKE